MSLTLAALAWLSSPASGQTFTAGMAERDGPGPFAAAPIVQGDAADAEGLIDDLLSFNRGTLIGADFYSRMDTRQGSIVFWWTPEYASADLSGTGRHVLFSAGNALQIVYRYDTDQFVFSVGSLSVNVNQNVSSGVTYSIVARWDKENALDGVNHASVSIDDVHNYGITSAQTPAAPQPNPRVGNGFAGGSTLAASGIIEGLTVYRRPLYDGANGVDAGFGDEIALIFNGGSGEDSTRVTGSWDVVLALPTDGTTGALTAGNGRAWSHPHSSNLLGGTGTGGFLLGATPVADGWVQEGTPSGVSQLAVSEKIFAGGFKITSSGTVDEGMRHDVTVSPGDDWVARAVAHSDGTCQPKVELYDQTNGATIGSLTGTTTSTRTAPDVLILTGEAPAGSTALRYRLVNAAANGTCYWQQAELLGNDLTNPSFEGGSNAGGLWIPTGWSNDATNPLGNGDSNRETGTVHSGSDAVRFSYSGAYKLGWFNVNAPVVTGRFYSVGAHANGGPQEVYIRERARSQFQALAPAPSASTNGTDGPVSPAGWTLYPSVLRADGVGHDRVGFGFRGMTGGGIVDDVYRFVLDDVSLTVSPADSSNSRENTDEIRVDGRDTYVQTGVGALTTTSGVVGFDWRPRHNAASGSAFDESNDDAYIVALAGDATNWVWVRWDGPNTIVMIYDMNGILDFGTWDATGLISANTSYPVQVSYTGGGTMTLDVGGVTRITLNAIEPAFGVAPNTVYFGSDSAGAHQGDATFANVTTGVELMSFAALALDSAVDLEWRTGSELNNLGFHLHRSSSEHGPWIRITSSLIPGLGSSPEGASYSFRDTGLTNGVRYYYRLEDIDAYSGSTFHGPVSAVPEASGDEEEDHSDSDGAPGDPDPDAEGPESRTYGHPEDASFRVVSRTKHVVVVELETPGFVTTETPFGVQVSVSGFDQPTDPRAPDLPVKRVVLDAVVGRLARLVSVQERQTQWFPGLTPAAVGGAEIVASSDGTVRPGRRAAALKGEGLLPPSAARIAGDAFLGETKKLALELSPLRYDAASDTLLLARTLRVKIAFDRQAAREETGRGSRGRRRPRSVEDTTPEVLAHLHTGTRGLHAVSFETLFPQDHEAIPLDSLRLRRQDESVPFHVEPRRKTFGSGSVLFFYASTEAASTDYSSEVAYALERAPGGVAMRLVSASPRRATPLAPASLAEASFETNRYYQAGLLHAPDVWLWDYLVGGMSKSFALTLEGVDPTSALSVHLQVVLQGASEANVEGEHHLSVSLNGTFLGETAFEGKLPRVFSTNVAASVLVEGVNTLRVTNLGDAGPYSFVFLDRVDLVYPQSPALRSGLFEGVFPEAGEAVLAGEASVGLDVTDPEAPAWLRGLRARSGTVSFAAQATHGYVLASPEGLLSPRVSSPVRSTLRRAENRAQYILIAPEAFVEAARPLLLRRQDQGLAVRLVSFEEIASEFGHGRASAEAIRDFLAYAYHSWSEPSVRYVLLLGDASYDPRNFTGLDQGAPLPAMWVKTSYLWTASDPTLGAVNGEDLLPDVAIGRLPAKTLEQAHVLVQKVLAFEDGAQDLSGTAVLVADNPDRAGDFEADLLDIRASFLADRPTKTLFVRLLGASTRGEILASFDEGASLMSYAGHGGGAVWASENVLSSWDPPKLLAQPRQPLMMTFNCLNGYFVAPNYEALSEAFLKAEGRGTIGAFSPSGLSLDAPAHRFHRALMAEITGGGHARLGDAVLAAQATYAETGLMPELLAIYHLFADPAMTIR